MTREENVNNVSYLIGVVQELASELNDEFTTTSETLESPNKKENGDPIYGEHKISSENNALDYTMKLYVSTQMGDPVIIIREPAGESMTMWFNSTSKAKNGRGLKKCCCLPMNYAQSTITPKKW